MLQGTSRPAHYHVILNQNQLSFDEVQHLSNTYAWHSPSIQACLLQTAYLLQLGTSWSTPAPSWP